MALTTAGREWVIDKVQSLAPLSNATMTAIAWGTGTNAEVVGDTALQTEASEARVTGTLSQPTTTTDRLVGTITAGGSKTISEVGRFNSTTPAGSTLLQRHKFTGIPVESGDSVTFTLDLTA
jgi:hypothetical protein